MITSDDGPLLLTFAEVVRQGSFSGAAATLRLSKSVVSERVRALEARCGARLLERTTRRMRLTEAGAQVLEASQGVEATLRRLSDALDAARSEPSGRVRVSTTQDLGPHLVAPAVASLVRAYPGVTVDIFSDDARLDLMEAEIDVAVRMGEPAPSSFVQRTLATLEEPVVAAPALAATLGPISHPRDLAGAPWVRHALLGSRPLTFSGPDGAEESIAPQARVEASSGLTLLSLLLHGAGVGVLPEHMLAEHLKAGRLVRLCAPWIWKRITLYALLPSRAFQRPAVKELLARLKDEVDRGQPAWGLGLFGPG